MQSWLGQGANLAANPQQLTEVLNPESLKAAADKAGASAQDVAGELSSVLPGLVDKLSPSGQLPGAANLGDALGKIPGGEQLSGLLGPLLGGASGGGAGTAGGAGAAPQPDIATPDPALALAGAGFGLFWASARPSAQGSGGGRCGGVAQW